MADQQNQQDIAALRLIEQGQALAAATENDLEERGLIVQTDAPYAQITAAGRALLTADLPHRVYGDWEWNEMADRPDNTYPARITGTWSGGVEFLTDKATAERIVEAQTKLRAELTNPEDVDALSWDGDVLVLTDIEGNVHRFEADTEGLYDCGFGWTWGEWTDDNEETDDNA